VLSAMDVDVVIADPDPVSALILGEILVGTGAHVDIAQDSAALAARLAVAPAPAAVILVAPLPGTSLATALAACEKAAPAAARFALVDQESPIGRMAALDAGADAVLALPVHPGELRSLLAAVLRRTTDGASRCAPRC
jgi:DNA-binding response OmpR family regulator